jgi:hypothetical protein
MSSTIYDIKKPLIKDDNWIIFPDSTFSQLNTMDCNDAMEGQCYENKSLSDCINDCKDSPECNFGYHISDIQGGKDICVPLRDGNIDSNPMYRLRNKSMYKEMDGITSTVFIDKTKYSFPPVDANIVFYMDNFIIKNTKTLNNLSTSPISEDSNSKSSYVGFEKDGDLVIQVLQIPPDLSAGTEYVAVKYGDLIAFNIPNTTLVMRPNTSNNRMEWVTRSFTLSTDSAFYLKPLSPGRVKGDKVRYSDTFSIHSNVSNISIDRGIDTGFSFISKMSGWYCNNDELSLCTEIPMEQMVVDEKGIGTYDGLDIGRNRGCWGVCKYKIKNQPFLEPLEVYKEYDIGGSNIGWYIILILILSVLILFFIVLRKH